MFPFLYSHTHTHLLCSLSCLVPFCTFSFLLVSLLPFYIYFHFYTFSLSLSLSTLLIPVLSCSLFCPSHPLFSSFLLIPAVFCSLGNSPFASVLPYSICFLLSFAGLPLLCTIILHSPAWPLSSPQTGPTRKGTPGEWTALEFSLKEAYNTFQQDGGEEGSIGKFQRALHFAMQIHRWTDAQDPIRGLLMLADALGFCGRVPEAKGWAQRVQQLVMHHSPQGEEDPLFKSAQETLDRCAAACGAEDPFLELVARGRELYLQDGREGEAVPVLQEALEVGKRRILWFGDLQVLLCMSTLADALRLSGQGRESEQVSWEVLRLMRQHAPDQAQCIEKVLGRMQEMGAEQVSSQEGFSSPFSRGMELYEERRYPEAKALLLDSLQVVVAPHLSPCLSCLAQPHGEEGSVVRHVSVACSRGRKQEGEK